ncbi:MAG: hypothetical protein ACRESV_00295 [Nevskiales bacterium]
MSESDPLVVNYLRDLRALTLEALHRLPESLDSPMPLLAHLTRHARLSAYFRAMQRRQAPDRPNGTYPEVEVYGLCGSDLDCRQLATKPFDASRNYYAAYTEMSSSGTHIDPELADFDAALDALIELPSARLDLLARETLSLTDNRLDAWITSFATKRLHRLREAGHGGTAIGGIGWLYNLRIPALESLPQDGAGFDPTPDTVGYIHAPSIDQAKTAALLRSGQQARADEGAQSPLDIDLSSERVRLARHLLDGIRQGQSLGALLGYRFERGLQDGGLSRYLPAFRDMYPLAAGSLETQPASSIAAATVVDGKRLVQALRSFLDAGFPHWLPAEVRASGNTAHQASLQLIAESVEAGLDAVGDATLAESVYQALRGNFDRAGATLDAVAKGVVPPPELESQRTPRQGKTFGVRVFLPMPDATVAPGAARGQAEPRLSSWCAARLGELERCVIEGRYHDAQGRELATRRIGLNALGLDPLDFVYLAAGGCDDGSDLVELLRDHLLANPTENVGAGASVSVHMRLAGLAHNQVDGATFVELGRALHALIAGCRALEDADLQQSGVSSTADIEELRTRADHAVAGFEHAAHTLEAALHASAPDAATLRAALLALTAYGVTGSVPARSADAPEAITRLQAQGAAVLEQVKAQLHALQALAANAPEGRAPSPAVLLDVQMQRLKQVFGASFKALPRFIAARGAEIAAGLSANAALLAGDLDAPEQFLARMASVRPAMTRLQTVRNCLEALDPERALPAAVSQLPLHGESVQWAALPGAEVTHGTLALLALGSTALDSAQPLAGLLVDGWEEVIPAGTQTTGLAFNFNAPNTEPPNAILLAVAPNAGQPWSTEALVDTVRELLQFMPRRASDQTFVDLGHFLPAAFFAGHAGNAGLSTDFSQSHPQ